MNKAETLAALAAHGISFEIREHPAIFTMEQMRELHLPHEESIARNLFLRDDKKRAYYLLAVHEEHHADLHRLRELLGSRPLSFASEQDLQRILGLQKGSVTPLGALNDQGHRVRVCLDEEFRGSLIGVHPNENTATIYLQADDLLKMLRDFGESADYAELI